jgi:hypothetical protein
MAVYIPTSRRRRTVVLAVLAGIVAGAILGYVVGASRGTSVDDAVHDSRDMANDAIAALGRLPIEYEQALTESRGESTSTLTASVQSARRLLTTAYDASPWLTSRNRATTNAAFATVRNDIRDQVDLSTFKADIAEATTRIAQVFGTRVARGVG